MKLREEVQDLEFTLKRLQTIRGGRSSWGTASSEKEMEAGTGTVWKDACARQLDRRLRAERENMHLMKSVEKDKQFVKSMQNLLGVRPALWNMAYPGTRKCTKRIEIPQTTSSMWLISSLPSYPRELRRRIVRWSA